MTTPVPPYRIVAEEHGYATLEFDYPDFTKGQTVVAKRIVGSTVVDDILRRLVEKRESTKDILRGGI